MDVDEDSPVSIAKQMLVAAAAAGVRQDLLEPLTPTSLSAGYGVGVCTILLALATTVQLYLTNGELKSVPLVYASRDRAADNGDGVELADTDKDRSVLHKKKRRSSATGGREGKIGDDDGDIDIDDGDEVEDEELHKPTTYISPKSKSTNKGVDQILDTEGSLEDGSVLALGASNEDLDASAGSFEASGSLDRMNVDGAAGGSGKGMFYVYLPV